MNPFRTQLINEAKMKIKIKVISHKQTVTEKTNAIILLPK